MSPCRRSDQRFVNALPVRPVLLGTVYDPTFGDDARNFLGIEARIVRANLRRVNEVIGSLAARAGRLVDLHAHFLTGDPSWFTRAARFSQRCSTDRDTGRPDSPLQSSAL